MRRYNLGHRYCPGKSMNLTGIAKCMYTDQVEDQTYTAENAYGAIHYAARRVATVANTDNFFNLNAEWTITNRTQYTALSLSTFYPGIPLYAPTDANENKNVMHRFGFMMTTPFYRNTNEALVFWNFRFSGVNAFAHVKLAIQATGRNVKGSPNLCEALGKGACNLKCGRGTCNVRIALRGSTRYIFTALGVTTSLRDMCGRSCSRQARIAHGGNRTITMEYKTPKSCETSPTADDVQLGIKPNSDFQWEFVKQGAMPAVTCDEAPKASLLSLEYVAKPFCQTPDDFAGNMAACLPTKPLCDGDVMNAVESSVGSGIKTAAYEWSTLKSPDVLISGNGSCATKGTNTKRISKDRVMYLSFEGGADCGDDDGGSDGGGTECAWKAEGDASSAKADLYEFTAHEHEQTGKDSGTFTPMSTTLDTAEYLDIEAKVGRCRLNRSNPP